MQRSNLTFERRSKAGAPQLDRGAVSSEPLDAWDWAGRISVVGLFVLAVGYTLFVVHELFVPVVTAWVMGAILRPIVEWAERHGVPNRGGYCYGDGCAPYTARNRGSPIYALGLLDRTHRRTRAADKGEIATTKSTLGDR